MFIKENYFLLDSGKNIIIYDKNKKEIYKVKDKKIINSLYTSNYDSQYEGYPFLSKKPREDKKFIKTIKRIEKNIILPLNDIGYASNLIYGALSLKKFFSLKYDQMPLFPSILNNLDKVVDYKDINSAVCLGDDDLFCLHLAEKGIDVTVYDIDPVLLNFYKFIKKKYNLNIETKQQDIFKSFKGKKYDLCYINPTPNEKSSGRFFSVARKMANKVVTIMPDQKYIYKYLGKPTLYLPLGDAAIQPYMADNKLEFIPNAYLNDIYYIEK